MAIRKRPRVPARVRRSALVAAVAASIVGGIGWFPGRLCWTDSMRRRSTAYHELGDAHSMNRTMHLSGGDWDLFAERDRWQMRIAEKYWRAARFPWLPVGLDGPPPDRVVRAGLDVGPVRWEVHKNGCPEPSLADRLRLWVERLIP